MKCSNNICHRPYSPPNVNLGEPYICRLAPGELSIELEWFDTGKGAASYTLHIAKRGSEDHRAIDALPGTITVDGLDTDTEYEFYIESSLGKRSRTRLARTGATPEGCTVINYLHPDDCQYIFSGRFLCSPSLVRTASGKLIAGMDVYGHAAGQNITLLYISEDNGETWHYLCDLYPFYWSTLFSINGVIYILGLSTEYGDLQISCSHDDGATWATPSKLLWGSNFLCECGGIERAPMHFTEHRGRLYTAFGYGSWKYGGHSPATLSIDKDVDPMIPENWEYSAFLPFEGRWREESKERGDSIEGNLVTAPDGCLYSYLRWRRGELLKLKINTDDLDAPPEYISIEEAPVSNSMFRIIPHAEKYYLITNRKSEVFGEYSRNVLSIFESYDLKNYKFVKDVINFEDKDPKRFGFQYPAFIKEDENLYLSVRSAFNNADSFHNSNYMLFYKTKL
ncbi:MAG: exo-alpha-sialidase [Ruminococcaceae bacterium]|nr:exo-alpha-sialidase [Oscillospiraceae bacterium]